MDTDELECILASDYYTNFTNGGVLAFDQLPRQIDSLPRLFIVNTDPSSLPGRHWVVIYFPNEECKEIAEYFDPLGNEPHRSLEEYLLSTNPFGRYVFSDIRVIGAYSDSWGATPKKIFKIG